VEKEGGGGRRWRIGRRRWVKKEQGPTVNRSVGSKSTVWSPPSVACMRTSATATAATPIQPKLSQIFQDLHEREREKERKRETELY
jgi:hypothetical protein